MAGEHPSGAEARGAEHGNENGSRLRTVLKIFFWFSVLCAGLVSLVGFYAYKRIREFRDHQANRARPERIDNGIRPVPGFPVDVIVESDDVFSPPESGVDADGTARDALPANNEAAPADAPLTGAHAAAREAAGVVINEIFFHPQSSWDVAEDTRQEFIELHNAGKSPVALEGYQLKKGVKFTFPAFNLPPGGHVVIAADPEVFRQQHPETASVLGGWDGKLSNSGEEIELENAEGETVDTVRYSDGGEWAARRAGTARAGSFRDGRMIYSSRSFRGNGSGGWEWQNPADGDGASLELCSAAVSNNNGQNWRPSRERGGTPGRVNSSYSPDIAPVISNAAHQPPIPTPLDEIVVAATIKDELKTGITAELLWRVSDFRSGPFKSAPMQAEGNRFSATIPAQPAGTIVEFFVRASDGTYSRTWPAATDLGQAANALFQVEAEPDQPAPGFALYRLIMTQQDNQNFQQMSRHTDAQVNATLIADDGAGPVVRHNCGVRYRGAGSRDHFPTPMRVNLPADQPWHGFTRMNLNSKYSWLQFIGMKLFADAGERAPDVKPATVRSNGQDLMAARIHDQSPPDGTRGGIKGGNETDYGYYVHAEPLGGEWVSRHFPEDPDGNSYKKVRPDSGWAYRNGQVRYYMQDGWSKNANAAAADWRDLDQLLRVMHYAPGESDYLDQVRSVADTEQWLRWFGINAILANGEGGIAKGVDDDYGFYRGVNDPRFKLLPHDLDTILSRGDRSRIRDPYHTLFDFAEYGETLRPLQELFDVEQVRREYLARIRDLLETTFAAGRFDTFLSNQLGGWVPESELRQITAWMNSRRAYAESEADFVLGARKQPRPAAESIGTLGSPPPPGLRINEILAAGSTGEEDFIELHNAGSVPVDASGWRLTDNENKPDKYVIPEGTVIAPGGFLTVTQSACGFRLEASGEAVFLHAPGDGGAVDAIAFGLQVPGFSIGRVGAGADAETWTLNRPTPSAANAGQALGAPAQLCINEWLAHPDMRFDSDFVELYNRDSLPVALGGIHITDDPFNYPEQFTVPPLSFVGAKGFVMFKAIGKDADGNDARHLPTRLAYEAGQIHVSGSNGVRIDQVDYQCHRRDISQGRAGDGSGRLAFFASPTPGTSNTAPPREETGGDKALMDSLRISEIMFHPIGHDGLEFVELTNAGPSPLNLKGVRFSSGITFEFEDDFELAPEGCAVIAANAVEFAAEYGEGIPIAGEFKGKLSNKGETLQLKLPKPSEGLIVSVEFDDKWQPDADGLGKSLVLKDSHQAAEACAQPQAWKASLEDRGSPGRLE